MSELAAFLSLFRSGAEGIVSRRQTTFWDVSVTRPGLAAVPATWRVTTSHRAESQAPAGAFNSVEAPSDHPLLADYSSAWSDVYVAGVPSPATLDDLRRLVSDATLGWRSLEHYLNLASVSSAQEGGGLLASAPDRLAESIAEVAREARLRPSLLRGAPARDLHQVILLGRGYLIARCITVQGPSA